MAGVFLSDCMPDSSDQTSVGKLSETIWLTEVPWTSTWSEEGCIYKTFKN